MISEHHGARLYIVLFFGTAWLAGCAGGGGASSGDDPVTMRWGGDLLGAGSDVNVADSITGDVIIVGEDLTFSGTAGGDYIGAGETHAISGSVAGDVRAAGREIRLTGQVARNVTAAGAHVEIGEGATIGGNAYLAGRLVRLGGTVDGFLRAAGQDIVLDGTVNGSVEVRGRSLRLGPGAVITGDLTYGVDGEDVDIDPSAAVGGSVTARPPTPGPPIELFRIVLMMGFLVAGVVVVALFAPVAAAAEPALRRHPGAALMWGIAWVLLVPIAIGIAALTLVGIPLALILLALYVISLYLARVVTALWLGEVLLRSRQGTGRGGRAIAFLIGAVLLLLVGLIPFVGSIVTIVATLVGLGALAVAYRSRREVDGASGVWVEP